MKRRDLFKGLLGTVIGLAVKPLAGLAGKKEEPQCPPHRWTGLNTGYCLDCKMAHVDYLHIGFNGKMLSQGPLGTHSYRVVYVSSDGVETNPSPAHSWSTQV